MLNKQELAYWCIVKERCLYLENQILPFKRTSDLNFDTEGARLIGRYREFPVYWLEAPLETSGVDFYSQRELLSVEAELFQLAGRATQLSHMLHTQRYCSHCGAVCQYSDDEIAMVCTSCQTPHYPRVSPCVIVAVRKDNKILLAQHPRHKTGMYTVIAGFVEAGETLEQCVAREIKEETGIEVDNIRYFGSQPWAFPSNLMMGFLADYASGDLKPDYTELTDAIWATRDTLPEVAPEGTIARSLIDHTLILMAEK
ncbi:NAD(+) diphosphatase [Photobacterium nomapromontoriensis]|uniref:NAD(+) diphosphatase n=1 Tax=Photobacterium nomapromontoriensis TaxID=2910237 RepID=UPI003D10ECE0